MNGNLLTLILITLSGLVVQNSLFTLPLNLAFQTTSHSIQAKYSKLHIQKTLLFIEIPLSY